MAGRFCGYAAVLLVHHSAESCPWPPRWAVASSGLRETRSAQPPSLAQSDPTAAVGRRHSLVAYKTELATLGAAVLGQHRQRHYRRGLHVADDSLERLGRTIHQSTAPRSRQYGRHRGPAAWAPGDRR